MWSNFKKMPAFLKFLTAHALASILLVIISLNPYSSFILNGRSLTYAEWWACGAGLASTLLGIALVVSAYLFLVKAFSARAVYLAVLALSLVVPSVVTGQVGYALLGVGVVYLFKLYMYGNRVSEYFASNNSLQARRP